MRKDWIFINIMSVVGNTSKKTASPDGSKMLKVPGQSTPTPLFPDMALVENGSRWKSALNMPKASFSPQGRFNWGILKLPWGNLYQVTVIHDLLDLSSSPLKQTTVGGISGIVAMFGAPNELFGEAWISKTSIHHDLFGRHGIYMDFYGIWDILYIYILHIIYYMYIYILYYILHIIYYILNILYV